MRFLSRLGRKKEKSPINRVMEINIKISFITKRINRNTQRISDIGTKTRELEEHENALNAAERQVADHILAGTNSGQVFMSIEANRDRLWGLSKRAQIDLRVLNHDIENIEEISNENKQLDEEIRTLVEEAKGLITGLLRAQKRLPSDLTHIRKHADLTKLRQDIGQAA
jgi:hypothetical protein